MEPRHLIRTVFLASLCALISPQVSAETFDQIIPSGVYVRTQAECERLKKSPLRTLQGVEGFEFIYVKGNEIRRYLAGICKVRQARRVGNSVDIRATCTEEGETTSQRYNLTIVDNTINFGQFDEVGSNWRFACEFNQTGLPKMFQFGKPSAATTPSNSPANLASPTSGDDAPTRVLIDRWYEQNSICRGSSDENIHGPACERRTELDTILNKRNWCYGKKGQAGAQMNWHVCTSNSVRPVR